MKKTTFAFFLICLLLIIGSFSSAYGAWQPPGSGVTPPEGNPEAPINTSDVGQTKWGNLTVNGLFSAINDLLIGPAIPISDNLFNTATHPNFVAKIQGDLGASRYCDVSGNNCKAITELGGNSFWTANGANISNTNTGKVGIGTGATAPAAKLEVVGEAQFTGTGSNSNFNYGSNEDTYIRGGKSGANVFLNELSSNTGNVIMAGNTGKVGIGTASPASGVKLDVNGTVKMTGFQLPAATNPAFKVLTANASGVGTWVTPTGLPYNAVMSTACSGANKSIKTISSTGVVTCEDDDVGAGLSGGVANKVAFWGGANTLDQDTNFHWDDTNKILSIGSAAPYTTSALYVNTTSNKPLYTMDAVNGGVMVGYGGNTIQARTTANSNAKDLVLQPYGGNVVINGPTGAANLTVGGTVTSDVVSATDLTLLGGGAAKIGDATDGPASLDVYGNAVFDGGYAKFLDGANGPQFCNGVGTGCMKITDTNRFSLGTATLDTTPETTVEVSGSVGATSYCDQNGENCLVPGEVFSSFSDFTSTATTYISQNLSGSFRVCFISRVAGNTDGRSPTCDVARNVAQGGGLYTWKANTAYAACSFTCLK